MSENMTEKYQTHYNKLLNGTFGDLVVKSISYQANIQLANDIIAEQEATIKELSEELDELKSSKSSSENSKINELENQVKTNAGVITRLQSDLNEANRLKSEYESIKHQVTHVDTFRTELVKERESHKKTRDEYELKLKELSDRIEYLQLTPAKRKKIDEEKNKVVEVIEEASVLPITEDVIKDGGSF
jgi:chromosome segregation ATPase